METFPKKRKSRRGASAWVHRIHRQRARGISLAWWYQALRRRLTGRPALHEARLVHLDPDVAVAWLQGRSTRAIVVFVSIQAKSFHPDKLQFRSFLDDGGETHLLFVLDRRRCWYSRPGMRDRIAEVVQKLAKREGIDTLWSIGVSMGGYGSILFCDRLPISRVLAFVPQILLTDEVTSKPAWNDYRGPIQPSVERDLTVIMADPARTFHLIYGDRDHDDPDHFNHLNRVLPDAEHIRFVIAPGQMHHVVPWLHQQGHLGTLIKSIWANDRAALQDCARRLDPPLDLSRAFGPTTEQITKTPAADQEERDRHAAV